MYLRLCYVNQFCVNSKYFEWDSLSHETNIVVYRSLKFPALTPILHRRDALNTFMAAPLAHSTLSIMPTQFNWQIRPNISASGKNKK